MREWCGCGAGIHGKPKQVAKWRKTHLHPQADGPQGTTSQAELSYQDDTRETRMGFTPNQEAS